MIGDLTKGFVIPRERNLRLPRAARRRYRRDRVYHRAIEGRQVLMIGC